MRLKNVLLIFSVLIQFSLADEPAKPDSSAAKNDSLLVIPSSPLSLIPQDSINVQFKFPSKKTTAPARIIPRPSLPANPLSIDTRSGSYYTPKNVQDKMDQIMNRPRQDSFMPVLAMAVFAAKVAAKHLEVEKLFALKAEDYLIPENQIDILEQLWQKAPKRIDELYFAGNLSQGLTAKKLQNILLDLTEKNLLKTRDAGENNILFFPAQRKADVVKMIKAALRSENITEARMTQLQNLLQHLTSEDSQNPKPTLKISTP